MSSISALYQRRDRVTYAFNTVQATILETLSKRNKEFNLGDIQPITMLTGEMKLKTLDKTVWLLWEKSLVEAGGSMLIEVVLDDPNEPPLREMDLGDSFRL